MLETRNLTRAYGKKVIVENLNLLVEAGSMLALLGPNGAGKSTTMKVLSATLPPTSGTYTIAGQDGRSMNARRRTGYVSDTRGLFPRLSAEEHLELACRLARTDTSLIPVMMEILELGELGAAPASTFSHGQSRRTSVAMALVTRPDLLLVDEPFDGVDPLGVDVITGLLQAERTRGAAVILTTHLLDAASIADRVAIFHGHTLLGPYPARDLLAEHGSLKAAWVALSSKDLVV